MHLLQTALKCFGSSFSLFSVVFSDYCNKNKHYKPNYYISCIVTISLGFIEVLLLKLLKYWDCVTVASLYLINWWYKIHVGSWPSYNDDINSMID